MKKRLFFTLLGLLIVFGGVFGYNAFVAYKTEQALSNRDAPTQTVSATEAATATWQPTVSAVGSVKAAQGVDVTAEIEGRVTNVAVADGARVKDEALMVELDAAGLRAELTGAQAEASLAAIELRRQRQLREQNVNSKADVDRAQSQLEQARARVKRIQARLEKKTIEAPFAGRLGILEVDVGEFIAAGTPVVTLQRLDPINVDFTIPQDALARVETGQQVLARADAYPDQPFSGQIRAISPKVNEATRNATVRARLANPEGRLRPGMFVDVAIQLPEEERVVTLPQTAITYNPYGDSVFLVNESTDDQGETVLTVERKFVETGASRAGQIQILKGIKAGQRVVTSGQLKLRNGAKVNIDNTTEPASDPSPELGNH
jgi:membrane fusion protein (multidrug efflux system)